MWVHERHTAIEDSHALEWITRTTGTSECRMDSLSSSTWLLIATQVVVILCVCVGIFVCVCACVLEYVHKHKWPVWKQPADQLNNRNLRGTISTQRLFLLTCDTTKVEIDPRHLRKKSASNDRNDFRSETRHDEIRRLRIKSCYSPEPRTLPPTHLLWCTGHTQGSNLLCLIVLSSPFLLVNLACLKIILPRCSVATCKGESPQVNGQSMVSQWLVITQRLVHW